MVNLNIKNPFAKKNATPGSTTVAPPAPTSDEVQDEDAERKAIEEQTETEEVKPAESSVKETKEVTPEENKEVTAEEVLLNHEARLQKIEYNLRLTP